jgi:PAS domain S-box-containing protein
MRVNLTGVERTFDEEEIIVSKTDLTGRVTYANDVFLRISGYTESEVLGQSHSIIRHPGTPRGVFSLLWRAIESGREIFAHVVNRAKNGDHYWVLATSRRPSPARGPSSDTIRAVALPRQSLWQGSRGSTRRCWPRSGGTP